MATKTVKQYTIPFDLKIVGDYCIKIKDFKMQMLIAGFERYNRESYLFYPPSNKIKNNIGGIIIKNTAIMRLCRFKTVMGKTSIGGEKVKISKILKP